MASLQVMLFVQDFISADMLEDDTTAINRALSDGKRCGANCLPAAIKELLSTCPRGRTWLAPPSYWYKTQMIGTVSRI